MKKSELKGSSPRMRGARASSLCVALDRRIIPAYAGSTRNVGMNHIGLGIIPAYAGSTFCASSAPILQQDHPRVCGEHALDFFGFSCVPGSSPRMRGARLAVLRDQLRAGIIPAYAGSTSGRDALGLSVRDHPRVCGERLR